MLLLRRIFLFCVANPHKFGDFARRTASRDTMKRGIARLKCGEGWLGRPIAFSSDDRVLITSGERHRVMSVPEVWIRYLGKRREYGESKLLDLIDGRE